MKRYALALVLLLSITPVSWAQEAVLPPVTPAAIPQAGMQADGEIVTDAICFNVINNAPYTVFGTFITNTYTAEDGTRARHRSNFRLETAHQSQFCTYGPFYEGRKLELVLRTLIPVFTCKTAITGDIVIQGRRKPEGGTDTWAVCLP
jgi:hypothetical protein